MTSSSNTLRAAPPAAPLRAAQPGGVVLLRLCLWAGIAALVVLPLAAVVWLAVTGRGWIHILTPETRTAALNSLVSASLSAAAAVGLATALVLLLTRTDLPGARWIRLLALSPLLIPPFVGAIAWLSLFGPSSALNSWWQARFGAPLWNLLGGDGVIFLLTIHSVPIAMIILEQALRRIPADLEQAARIAGASPLHAFVTVTVPLLRPAMLASFTLIAVANLADFGIPAIIGLPERYTTLSTLIYRFLQSGTVADPLAVTAAIGFVLLVIAVIGLWVDPSRRAPAVELDTQASHPNPLPLGWLRLPAAVVTAGVVTAGTLLPLVTLTMQALVPAPGVPFTPENISLDGFVRAVTAPKTVTGVLNSVGLAGGAALICGVLGLLLGTLITRTTARSNRLLYGLAILPQAVPGLVIAVAWLLLAPHLGVYNTPWVILLAYVTSFVALVVQAVVAPLSATPATAEQAARVAGASALRSLWDVSCRLALPAAASGALLVALTAVRELTLSVLLLSPGAQTLGVVIFNLHQSGSYNAAAALSVLVAAVGLLSLGLLPRTKAAPSHAP